MLMLRNKKERSGDRSFFEAVEKLTFFEPPPDKNHAFGRNLKKNRALQAGFRLLRKCSISIWQSNKQNRHIRRETSVCAGFRLQLRKILVSQLQIVRKQRPQPFFAAGTVPRYRRWTDPKPFSALFAG
mgnify:CR=1 FL=1